MSEIPEEVTYKIAPITELKNKLSSARITGLSPITDKFFISLVEQLGDTERTPDAINFLWETTKSQKLEGEMPILIASVDMNFDRFVNTTITDPTFAEQTKVVRKEFLENLRKKD